MPYGNPYSGPQIDFSPLLTIGENIAGGLSKRWQRQATEKALQSGDYNEAFMNLLKAGDVESARALATYSLAKSDREIEERRHQESLVPPDVRLLDWWKNNGGGGAAPAPRPAPESTPMYLGPEGSTIGQDYAQAARNMPASIANKILPLGEQERIKQEGKNAAAREQSSALAGIISNKVQKVLDTLDTNVKGIENDTFENAFGPWQGVPDAETWQGAAGQFFPQTAGAVANWASKVRNSAPAWSLNRDWSGSKGQTTSEVRAMIHGTTATLVNLLKPLIRVKGEGAQSDRDMQVIQQQVGELAKSKTKDEFTRRLGVVVGNMRGLGLDVNLPGQPPMDMAVDPSAAQVAPPQNPNELPVYSRPPAQAGVVDPRGAYFPQGGAEQGMNRQAAPDGTVINNGKQRLQKVNGKWVPI